MKIKEHILKILSDSRLDGNKLYLQGTLSRKDYTDTNMILESAGGKWSRKEKAHVFPTDASDRLEQILLTGETELPREDFDFYPTNQEISLQVSRLAEISEGMEVLEPSAGHGALIKPALALGAKVTAVEIAKANQAVLEGIEGIELIKADFLEMEPGKLFDRIIMNPPFGRQMDIKHVNHALKFLKPGGILVAIMASSVLWRDNRLTSEFRNFIYDHGGTIEKLPDASFKEAGTMVGTVIVKVQI